MNFPNKSCDGNFGGTDVRAAPFSFVISCLSLKFEQQLHTQINKKIC